MPCEVQHLNSTWKASQNKAVEIFKDDQIQDTRLSETGLTKQIVVSGISFDKTRLKAGDFMYSDSDTPAIVLGTYQTFLQRSCDSYF